MTDEELMAMARLAQRDERMSTGALYGDLADHIEALTKKREQWRRAAETRAEGWKISDDARIEAEAKLEKAVEGLKRICMQPDYRLPSPQEIARATLAEISSHNKGESHE